MFERILNPVATTTIARTVSSLRRAIMQGDLRPGQKLIESELCRELEVSRPSLREALRALQAEKLIDLVPNRGPSVAKLIASDIEAIHEVWALLTGEAVYDFTKIAKPAQKKALASAIAVLQRSVEDNWPIKQLAATNDFFLVIMLGCGNAILTEMVFRLISRINFLRAQALLHQGCGVLYAQEIEAIRVEIEAGDAEAARRATRKHIATACTAAQELASMTSFGRPAPRSIRLPAASPEAPDDDTKRVAIQSRS